MSARTHGRRVRLVIALLGGLVAWGCGEAEPPPGEGPERVVLIVADTLRRDHVSPYGERVQTPNLTALAERGQVFGNAFSSYHQTTMSMAALFTGHTPSIDRGRDHERLDWTGETWCGLERFSGSSSGDCIPAGVRTLAEAYRAAGYQTLGVVSNWLLYQPGGYERGFDRWVEVASEHPTGGEVNRAVQEVLAERTRNRFFLYVHYMDAHDYYLRGWSYARGAEIIDQAVGRLLGMLEAQGLMEGTVVVFTSDHGEHLPEEQHFIPARRGHTGSPSFDSLLKVPLIVAPPLFRNIDAPVRSDDVHRMLLALAGLPEGPAPELMPGELYLSEREFQTYRGGGFKSFRFRKNGQQFLVDLRKDPGERTNVAERHPHVLAEHAARMDALEQRLGAPEAPRRILSDEDRARLKALGYEAEP